MLDLRRLRLLHELHARGTIAAVAEALRFTPSAVSQQLAVLEREAGVALLERAGRGVRLTDAALVLVGHADALLERAEQAEADLAAAAGRVAGRGRIASFQSAAFHLVVPALQALARDAPELRCELVEAEPEESCRRSRSATSISSWPTSGSTSRSRVRRASTARTSGATPSTSCSRRAIRPRGVTAGPCRSPSSPAMPGRPAIPRRRGRR